LSHGRAILYSGTAFVESLWMRTRTFSNIGFIADDVEKTYNTLTEPGVEFEKPPKKESWGRSAVFKDLDGNTFALSSK
jgi:predicted enzyme related to lactoylglutathione lyase